ncbi:deoxyribonuclease IV [Thermostilla marina]
MPQQRGPRLGAHMSIAGGFDKAVDRAVEAGCDCFQVFTKNNNQWNAPPLTREQVSRFQRALEEAKLSPPIAHDSYLINLASPDDTLWRRSIDAMIVELQRADRLGIPGLVAHPGAFTTSTEEKGIARIVKAIDHIFRKTRAVATLLLLETTAGQGTSIGHRFEHLAEIIQETAFPERLGVCFDTCHVFAAGYPLAPHRRYLATMREFDKVLGLERIRAFHLNDSRTPAGSRVDRHAHIGQGQMGLEPFASVVNDRRFRGVPMCLETPKGELDGDMADRVNLRQLRNLIKKRK